MSTVQGFKIAASLSFNIKQFQANIRIIKRELATLTNVPGLGSISDAMKKGTSGAKTLGTSMDKVSAKTQSLASAFKNFNRSTALFQYGLTVMAGKYIFDTLSQFEDGMKRVKVITGATTVQFEALGNAARDAGLKSIFTTTQAAEALKYLAMAGTSAYDSTILLDNVLDMAAASASDLGFTADALTNIMASYRVEVKEATHLTDVLTMTVNSTNTDFKELSAGMREVGSTAVQFGFNIEEVSTVLGLMANRGFKGSRAGVALAMSFQRLLRAPKEVRDTLKKLDIEMDENRIKELGLIGVLKEFKKSNMTAAEGVKLFGRHSRVLNSILNVSNAEFDALLLAIEKSDGATKKAAKEGVGGLTKSWYGLRDATTALIQNLGDSGLTAILIDLIELTTSVVEIINRLTTSFQVFGVELNPVYTILKLIAVALDLVYMPLKAIFNLLTGNDWDKGLSATAGRIDKFFSMETDGQRTYKYLLKWKKKVEGLAIGKVMTSEIKKALSDVNLLLKDTPVDTEEYKKLQEMQRFFTNYLKMVENQQKAAEDASKRRRKAMEDEEDKLKKLKAQYKDLEDMTYKYLIGWGTAVNPDTKGFVKHEKTNNVIDPKKLVGLDKMDSGAWDNYINKVDSFRKMIVDTGEAVRALNNVFDDLSSAIADMISTGKADWAGYAVAVLKSLNQVVNAMLAQLIIGTAAQEGSKFGLYGLIAAAIGLPIIIGSLQAMIKKNQVEFAMGGIVPGSSYTGDKVPARVNSGEMILNASQQSRLFAMANGAGGTGGQVEFKIKGDTLVGVLSNHNRRVVKTR